MVGSRAAIPQHQDKLEDWLDRSLTNSADTNAESRSSARITPRSSASWGDQQNGGGDAGGQTEQGSEKHAGTNPG